jgi:hypothetical protein
VYNDLLQLISPNAVYEAGYAGPEERSRWAFCLPPALRAPEPSSVWVWEPQF